jgi:hypothetical protein
MCDVPSAAYISTNMFNSLPHTRGGEVPGNIGQQYTSMWFYMGPSYAVNRVAVTVGTQGGILPVIPPSQNSTWNVTFYGPSIRCGNVSSSLHDAITLNIAQYLNETLVNAGNTSDSKTGPSYYLAWTPSVPSNFSPEDPSFGVYARPFNNTPFGDFDVLNRIPGDMVPLYVGIFPSALKWYSKPEGSNMSVIDSWDGNTPLSQIVAEYINPDLTLIQCDMYNATYDVVYTLQSGLQTVESTVALLANEPLHVIKDAYGFTPEQDYAAYVVAPKIGDDLPAPADCQGLWNGSFGSKTTCAFDASVLGLMSYQAVWDAFTGLVRGRMYLDFFLDQMPTIDTSVLNTILSGSTEMKPIITLFHFQVLPAAFSAALIERYSSIPGMSLALAEVSPPSFSVLLEELFQNITLSLATSAELQ